MTNLNHMRTFSNFTFVFSIDQTHDELMKHKPDGANLFDVVQVGGVKYSGMKGQLL